MYGCFVIFTVIVHVFDLQHLSRLILMSIFFLYNFLLSCFLFILPSVLHYFAFQLDFLTMTHLFRVGFFFRQVGQVCSIVHAVPVVHKARHLCVHACMALWAAFYLIAWVMGQYMLHDKALAACCSYPSRICRFSPSLCRYLK